MSDILKRGLAPIPAAAWNEIDEQAKKILGGNLSARTWADFEGPHGWELAAINLGGIEPGENALVPGVEWGRRQVMPLVEFRVPFALSAAELESLARGSKTPDLGPLDEAAQQAALFEEQAVYRGHADAGISGVLEATDNEAVKLPKSADGFAEAIEEGVHRIQSHGIGGPFVLVLGRQPYQTLAVGDGKGFPLKSRVLDLLEGGEVRWSPALSSGALLSRRGGDFELTVGQDLSIGYAGQDGDTLRFFVTESFAFRVLEPAAAVELA